MEAGVPKIVRDAEGDGFHADRHDGEVHVRVEGAVMDGDRPGE